MTYSNGNEGKAAGTTTVPDQHGFTHFTVVKHALKVVLPAEPTPEEETIYLTNIDQMLVVPVESFFVYSAHRDRSSESVASVLEAALAKLLVPYHFMAGRFEVNEAEDRLQVKCNRAGVGFVVASSEQTVEELGDLKAMNPEFRKLLPAPPGDNPLSLVDDFLLMVQVTRFKCGGFAVGFRMSHSMCDGMSSAQFFRSYCTLARGEPLTTFPELDRTIHKPRDPPTPEFNHTECFKLGDYIANGADTSHELDMTPEYITKHIAMSSSEIQTLKTIAMADGSLMKCSSFEVTIAHFWQSRTRALEFGPEEISSIFIAVDFRSRMNPPIPPKFCGNTIISAHASAPAAEVARSPLSFCVRKIQEAIARVDERYVRSAIDWLQIHGGVPALGSTNDVLVSAWWKLPFYEHDYGWGKPAHAGPPPPEQVTYSLIVSDPNEDSGLLLLVSFRSKQMLTFERYLKNL